MRYLDASFRARSAFAAAHRLPDESSVFGFTLDASDESAPVPLLVAGARAEAAGADEKLWYVVMAQAMARAMRAM